MTTASGSSQGAAARHRLAGRRYTKRSGSISAAMEQIGRKSEPDINVMTPTDTGIGVTVLLESGIRGAPKSLAPASACIARPSTETGLATTSISLMSPKLGTIPGAEMVWLYTPGLSPTRVPPPGAVVPRLFNSLYLGDLGTAGMGRKPAPLIPICVAIGQAKRRGFTERTSALAKADLRKVAGRERREAGIGGTPILGSKLLEPRGIVKFLSLLMYQPVLKVTG